ncbi:MAG: methyl-accepting chemotaxis protein, partial [SAR324 cluster bacterium]|nr:methyl-accepting chemotaxis protein [SAR324 cluster bacterium]
MNQEINGVNTATNQVLLRKSIRTRLVVGLGAFIVSTMFLVGVFSSYNASILLEQGLNINLNNKISHKSAIIRKTLDAIVDDVRFFAKATALHGMVRALNNNGVDPLTHLSYSDWKDQLAELFYHSVNYKKHYMQLRFIGKDGQELVRVDGDGSKATKIPDKELQNKSTREYFIKTAVLPNAEIYVSPLDLNVERGEIEHPFKPVIRYSTPVFDEKNVFAGIVIVNIFAKDFLDTLADDSDAAVYLMNQEGYYLKHPDSEKEWGFMLNKDTRIQQDYPKQANILLSGTPGVITAGDRLLFYAPIDVNNRLGIRWTLVMDADKQQIFTPIYTWQLHLAIFSLFVLLVSFVIAFFFIEKLMAPLHSAITVIDKVAMGDLTIDIQVTTEDEIGQLMTSVKTMVDSMNTLAGELQDGTLQLTASSNQISASAMEQMRNITGQYET